MQNEKSLQGKKSRAAGSRFEVKVREDLERLGWTVSKWMNTVEQEKDGGIWKLNKVRNKFLGPGRPVMLGAGFPDLVCFKRHEEEYFDVIGVEAKRNGYLDVKEKSMARWLIENKIFSRILIAKPGKKRGEVEYVDFAKKYDGKYIERNN